MARILVLAVTSLTGCTAPLPPGALKLDRAPSEIPGPMPGFGPFRTALDALGQACPFLLSLPNATASRQDKRDEGYRLAWDQSTESCAWIYYTPAGDYEMSQVITPEVQADPGSRTCFLPPHVRDSRYLAESLRYVVAIHTHPLRSELSRGDIQYIIRQGRRHGMAFNGRDGQTRLAAVAFFRQVEGNGKGCDGFFQYIPLTGELQEWNLDEDSQWKMKSIGRIKYEWKDGNALEVEILRDAQG